MKKKQKEPEFPEWLSWSIFNILGGIVEADTEILEKGMQESLTKPDTGPMTVMLLLNEILTAALMEWSEDQPLGDEVIDVFAQNSRNLLTYENWCPLNIPDIEMFKLRFKEHDNIKHPCLEFIRQTTDPGIATVALGGMALAVLIATEGGGYWAEDDDWTNRLSYVYGMLGIEDIC